MTWLCHLVLFLLNKKVRGISKLCFHHIDQSVSLNFELRYNERTLALFLTAEFAKFRIFEIKPISVNRQKDICLWI